MKCCLYKVFVFASMSCIGNLNKRFKPLVLFLEVLFYCIFINGLHNNANNKAQVFRLCKRQLPVRFPKYLKDSACANANSASYRFVVSCIRRSTSVVKSAEIVVKLCSKVVS